MRNPIQRFIGMCRRILAHWQVPPEPPPHVGRISSGEPASEEAEPQQEQPEPEEKSGEDSPPRQ
ncbi:hypothetical protein [Natronoglycomyces albus]|uniref:Uncharacterized protein n=1 Tax=Natronoglycomyces albus TaxID=2811108 RepID=A0A895XH38_9ACTN|nr:hypothetical protein [Natronoglycomyces albus]QSB04664.1 hypothetical protein JQS30_12905 [Natronoglycomyces albus]